MTETVDPQLLDQIKTILRRDLKLGASTPIADDMPLVGGEMDLDSLDILLLVSSIEKQFAIKIPSEVVGRWVFTSVATLAKYVADNRDTLKSGAAAAATLPAVPASEPPAIDWLSRLPHGPAFRFVSRVEEVLPGQRARGVWELLGSESFFEAHFPGHPIVPGVLLTEAMAQVAGLCAAGAEGRKSGMIVHVDVRFEHPVAPPATIELTAEVAQVMGSLLQCNCEAASNGTVVARASITLHVSGG